MPELITTRVYRLGELSASAVTQARAWYRCCAPDDDWPDFVFEDFKRICTILGVDLATRSVRLFGGGTRQESRIWFSGFSSQGDGACFEGSYRYAKSASRAIRRHAPQDVELHRIADRLMAVQRCNFYQLEADVRHQGRYYHEYTMTVAVERATSTSHEMSVDAENAITEALCDLARWLYRQLEQEYDYQTSDAVIDETIIANDYSFTEYGERFP